jgi:hypothetical protein
VPLALFLMLVADDVPGSLCGDGRHRVVLLPPSANPTVVRAEPLASCHSTRGRAPADTLTAQTYCLSAARKQGGDERWAWELGNLWA